MTSLISALVGERVKDPDDGALGTVTAVLDEDFALYEVEWDDGSLTCIFGGQVELAEDQ